MCGSRQRKPLYSLLAAVDYFNNTPLFHFHHAHTNTELLDKFTDMKAKVTAKNKKKKQQLAINQELEAAEEYKFPLDALGLMLESIYEEFLQQEKHDYTGFDINTNSRAQRARNEVVSHLQKRWNEGNDNPKKAKA
jgi:hypothetical protein